MKKSLSILLIAFVAASCAVPRVVTNLTPDGPEGHIQMGREYITLENDSIVVELGFDGTHGENMVFDFVVINKTPGSLRINPSDFYYLLLDSAMADTSKLPPRMAVHPERILHRYDETLDARADEKMTNTILGFIEAGIGLVANATAFIATEDPGYMVDAVFSTIGTADHYVSQDKMIGKEIDLIDQERKIVTEEIFRLSELPSGKVVSGYVYFPNNHDADCFMFCFPVEDQLFQFVYNQDHEIHYY